MSNAQDPVAQQKKLSDARELSKWGQFVAALWIAGISAIKFWKMDPAAIDVTDIILSGISIGGCFAPTFVSIWLDKLVELRKPR